MHIEPGVVNGAKIGLSYLTGAVAIALGICQIRQQYPNSEFLYEHGLHSAF